MEYCGDYNYKIMGADTMNETNVNISTKNPIINYSHFIRGKQKYNNSSIPYIKNI